VNLLTLLIIVLVIVLLLGGGGYRYGWYGTNPYYGPGFGLVGAVVLILILLALMGRI
jgi:hypothetical protein